MSRRRRREGAGAIVREVRARGARIVDAIERLGEEQDASGEAMEEGSRRAVVVDPGTGHRVRFTPEPGNEDDPKGEDEPPASCPR